MTHDMIDFAFRALLSIAIGGLIGLERERGKKMPILGMRTFSLVAFLGFILSFFTQNQPYGWLAISAGFAGTFALAVMYYFFRVRYSYYGKSSLGLTTTFVIPLAFFLGTLIGWGLFLEAGVAAIACVYLLIEKKELREIGETITKQELLDLLLFIVIAFIIYPQLPVGEVKIDGLGFGVNLQYFWFIVVLVSAISFAGHIISKFYSEKAVFYAAFLGGFVSSVATTAVFLKKTKDERILLVAIVSAALASTFSNGAILLVTNPNLFRIAIPIVAAFAVYYGIRTWFALSELKKEESLPIERRALSLRFSLEFAVFFFAVSLVLGSLYSSPAGAIAFSFLGGLVSSISVYAAVAYAYNTGAIQLNAALYSLAFASIGSLTTKTVVASLTVKNPEFKKKLFGLLALAAIVGITAAFLSG